MESEIFFRCWLLEQGVRIQRRREMERRHSTRRDKERTRAREEVPLERNDDSSTPGLSAGGRGEERESEMIL